MLQALDYVRKGLSVIPVRAGQKEPPLVRYKEEGFTQRIPTQDEVRAWWSRWPDANVAIVTGEVSGVTVIDVDRYKGGAETVARLGLHSPLMASASRGGLHLFFHYSPTVKTWVEKLGDGLDVRNDGGYIMASPSIHPSGKRYAWLTAGGFNRSLLTDLKLTVETKLTTVNNKPRQSVIEEALGSLGPGSRHYQFSRVIGKLNSLGIKPAEIILLLKPYAEAHQFSEIELETQVNRMCTLYAHEAPQVTEDKTYNLLEFLAEEEKVEWISDGFLARKTIGFVAGLGESFKTWAMIELAVECARGGHWLGRFPTEKCKVLYIDQERFKGETRKRFESVIKGKGLDPSTITDMLHLKCGTTIRIDLQNSYEAFRRELTELKPDLVIVDSFATFHTKDGSNNNDMQFVMERIKALRTALGCTFLFIDHETKGVHQRMQEGALPTKEDMLGAVAKSNAAEFVLTFRKDSEITSIVHHTKSTLCRNVDPFTITLNDIDGSGIKVEALWNVERKKQ